MVTPSTPPVAPYAPVDIDAQSGGATLQRDSDVNLVVPASSSPAKRRRVDHPQAPPPAGKTLTRDSEVSAVVATRVAHGLRWVEPYHHTFETHAKGRWVGREVLEVFAKEFQSEPREAYEHAIEAGRITMNGLPVTATTIVRDNDLIRNTAHRHEPPVIATELDIIHEDNSVVAVDKPASMPVHACGRFVALVCPTRRDHCDNDRDRDHNHHRIHPHVVLSHVYCYYELCTRIDSFHTTTWNELCELN